MNAGPLDNALLRRLLAERPPRPRAHTKNWGDKERAEDLAAQVLASRETADLSTLLAEALLIELASRGITDAGILDELCGTIVYLVRALEPAVLARREDALKELLLIAYDLFAE